MRTPLITLLLCSGVVVSLALDRSTMSDSGSDSDKHSLSDSGSEEFWTSLLRRKILWGNKEDESIKEDPTLKKSFESRLSLLSKVSGSGREYPFYASKDYVTSEEVLGTSGRLTFSKKELEEKVMQMMRDEDHDPSADLAIFSTASRRRDCLKETFFDIGERRDRDLKEYVDAEMSYTNSLRLWINSYTRSTSISGWSDGCRNVLSKGNCKSFLELYESFLGHMMGEKQDDGDKRRGGIIRTQLDDWFNAAAQYAQVYPGTIRSLRKTLGNVLGLLQASMIKKGNEKYPLTVREIDELLNLKAPAAMSASERKDQCRGHLSGDVGNDPAAILEVVANGNLREMVQLIVATLDNTSGIHFKGIVLEIAEAIYGKVPEKHIAVSSNKCKIKVSEAKKDKHMQPIESGDMDEYDVDEYKACNLLVEDANAHDRMMQWLREAGININFKLLWYQYRRYLFGENVKLPNPDYSPGADADPTILYHINGWAEVTNKIRSDPSFFYKKGIWTPQPGWVMSSRLPGEFAIREKTQKKLLRKIMRESDQDDEVHPAVWTWGTMFEKLKVSYVSRREINWMQHCHDYRKLADKRWAMFSPKISMSDRCPWDSGRVFNTMLDKRFPLFSPTKPATYEQISTKQFGAVDAGPSGTTDEVLLTTALMNGNTNDLYAARLGMIGYLVPYHHHTWLEVLQGGSGFGMEYDEKNPGKGLMRSDTDISDAYCKPGKLQPVDGKDIGMGPVGDEFDREITSLLALRNLKTDEPGGDIWRNWKLGVSTQHYDVSYTMTEEGTMLKFCQFAWEKDKKMKQLVNTVIPFCRRARKGAISLHRAVCAFRSSVIEDGSLVSEIDLTSQRGNNYLETRAAVCQEAKGAFDADGLDLLTAGWSKSCRGHSGNCEGDFGLGEILSLCAQINTFGHRRKTRRFWDSVPRADYDDNNNLVAWHQKAHKVFLRDLNGLMLKLAPSLTNRSTGEVNCSLKHELEHLGR